MDPASISSQQLRLRSVIIFTPEGVVKRMLEICSKDRVCTGSYGICSLENISLL